jgi:hypothetical protein
MTGSLYLTIADPPEVLAFPVTIVHSAILGTTKRSQFDQLTETMGLPRLSIRSFHEEQFVTKFCTSGLHTTEYLGATEVRMIG